jgi:cell shape-determining protein MreD
LAAALLQVSLAWRISLLQGPADLVLLVLLAWMLQEPAKNDWRWGILAGLILSLFSSLPFWVPLTGYAITAIAVQLFETRVWQNSLLTLFTAIVVGIVCVQATTLLYLWLNANPIAIRDAFNLVTMPSIILSMILALPIYGLVGELTQLLIPSEVEP